MTNTTAVATAAPTNLAALFGQAGAEMPVYQMDEKYSNAGNEHVGAGDVAIPTIDVLQALSPEIETVPGAKAGLLYNSATGELATELFVVNLNYKRDWALFRKRNRGGGFHGTFQTAEEAQAKIPELPGAAEDYDVVETGKHALMLLNIVDGAVTPGQIVLIRFKSTGLAVSKNWNTQIQVQLGADKPRFIGVWKLTSEKRTKDQNTWFVPKVEFMGTLPSQELFEAAALGYEQTSMA